MKKVPQPGRAPRVALVSLGCPKNTVDSEVMMGQLASRGISTTSHLDSADVVVVNTCGFIEAAREESIDTILEFTRLKQEGRDLKVVVTGCMVQRYREELRREIPEVDAFVDLDGLDGIASVISGQSGVGSDRRIQLPALAKAPMALKPDGLTPSTYLYGARTPRIRSTPPWSAYIKIAEGCDNTCAFCAIPRFRGAFRSRPLDDIVEEAGRLAAEGVQELNLVAQDSTAYGSDRGLSGGPTELLAALAQLEGPRWIRLHYLFPNKLNCSLLDLMARHENIASYIDLPLQHAADSVLARMRRGGSAGSHLNLLAQIRKRVPGVAIRTTMIVGFPGETAEEFEALCDFVKEARFESLGTFIYSHEENTPAFDLQDDVLRATKEERQTCLMAIQESIALENSRARIGKTLEVLCEGACTETDDLLQGRMESQAPEIDGRVLINEGEARPGHFYQVQITEAHPFDLVGRVLAPA